MSQFVKINFGTAAISKDMWQRLKKKGYTREDIRQLIVQNGEESLADLDYEYLPEEEKRQHEKGKNL